MARFPRDLGYNQQAIYCYSKVYSLDPTNVDALWDRASLAKEINDLRAVRSIIFYSRVFNMSTLCRLDTLFLQS